jgi:hypothetical protein
MGQVCVIISLARNPSSCLLLCSCPPSAPELLGPASFCTHHQRCQAQGGVAAVGGSKQGNKQACIAIKQHLKADS